MKMNEWAKGVWQQGKIVTSIIWRICSLLKGGGCCSDPAMIDIKELK